MSLCDVQLTTQERNSSKSIGISTPDRSVAVESVASSYSYRHDPYNFQASWVVFGGNQTGQCHVSDEESEEGGYHHEDVVCSLYSPCPTEPCRLEPEVEPRRQLPDPSTSSDCEPPAGTLHGELWGLLGFTPYPAERFDPPLSADREAFEQSRKGLGEGGEGVDIVRIFIGQVPYFVSEMELAWIIHTFSGGRSVICPERILKRNPSTGIRKPTGCLHAFTTREGLAAMVRYMHKQLLIDDTGVWYCRSEEECVVLADYCNMMKADIRSRPWNRPYDSIVVQEADSGCFPHRPTFLNPAQSYRDLFECHRAAVRKRQVTPPEQVDSTSTSAVVAPFGGNSHLTATGVVHRDLRTEPFYRPKTNAHPRHQPPAYHRGGSGAQGHSSWRGGGNGWEREQGSGYHHQHSSPPMAKGKQAVSEYPHSHGRDRYSRKPQSAKHQM